MTNASLSVEVRQLDLRFGELCVLQDLDLDIRQGEFLVLLGSSGCGKSTLLNCIAGLLEPSDGQIIIQGRNVTWSEPSDRGIGMVFQSYALYPQMTVRGNLSFGLKNARLPKREIESRVARAADILQIEPLLDRKPGALSGGQRQRVAIGRALVRDVDVFLFDEPLSNLDAKLRGDLRVELKRLHHSLGNTMIYVTHDQVEAMTLADRIAIMRDGRILQLGTPDEIYWRPQNRYVAGFIGSPAMNFIDGRLADGVFRSGALDMPMTGYRGEGGVLRDGPVTLGIRPEHVFCGSALPSAAVRSAARVDIVEPMGADTLVYADLGGTPIKIRMTGSARPASGDRLEIGFDPAWASLFDPADEGRL
ncbi:ABC transporter ATP-binding protein [Fodinicurvata sp. EGI_FJ10296]|uniref:ABC transporter ATP-binding protein n=1 Tax=Fodinicurvata sp. EGI_FJ10296 TaxID=3231908 RepID=UPI003456245D